MRNTIEISLKEQSFFHDCNSVYK